MSTGYDIMLTVKEFDADKAFALAEAIHEVFEYDDWYENLDKPTCIEANGSINLSAGRTDDEFASDLAKAVWKANGKFCEVKVHVRYIEQVPTDDYTFEKEDYEREMT